MNKFSLLLLFIVCLFSAGCFSREKAPPNESQINSSNESASGETRGVEYPQSDAPLPKALEVSREPRAIELANKINELIEESEFRNANWGVFVASAKDGRTLVARDAQRLFNPASTQKIVTTAIALDKFGADFRWKTSVLAASEIDASGVLNGDLILYGRGAPDFDEAGVRELVNQLKQKGLRRVAGNIVGDASFLRAENLGAGWVWEEAQWYYGAEPSALSYSDNTVLVEITPADKLDEAATVKTIPEAGFIKITNNATTTARATNQTFGVHRDLDSNNFQIWGEIPRGKPLGVRMAAHQPELWAANDLKKTLEQNGVGVTGAVQSFDWRTSKLDAVAMKELAAVESGALAEIVKRTNKRSINLNAELIFRTLGHAARETADADQTKRKTVLGDDQMSAMFVKNWLAAKGVDTGDTVIQDGSGLSRLNFITPETMGRLLIAANRIRAWEAFRDSLPIAGTDGTMGGRLPKFKGRVIAKTGTIAYVSSLAGYAQTESGEILAFVIFCNNETRRGESTVTIDRIASLIADYGTADADGKSK